MVRAEPPSIPVWAVVLAGDRAGGDALARHFGTTRKAIIAVAGMPMLTGVVAASALVERIILAVAGCEGVASPPMQRT